MIRQRRRQHPGTWVAAFGAVCLVLTTSCAPASHSEEGGIRSTAETAQGLLRISGGDSAGVARTFRITLDGTVIDEEADLHTVFIHATYPPGKARLVLLRLGTGGSGCPVSYKVIEVKPDKKSLVSEEFGNCSEAARTSWQRDGWRIDMPAVGNASAQSWLYRDGKLTRLKPSPRP